MISFSFFFLFLIWCFAVRVWFPCCVDFHFVLCFPLAKILRTRFTPQMATLRFHRRRFVNNIRLPLSWLSQATTGKTEQDISYLVVGCWFSHFALFLRCRWRERGRKRLQWSNLFVEVEPRAFQLLRECLLKYLTGDLEWRFEAMRFTCGKWEKRQLLLKWINFKLLERKKDKNHFAI